MTVNKIMKSRIPTCLLIVLLSATVNAGCPSMCKCSDTQVSCKGELLEGVPNFESLEVKPQTIDLSDNDIYSIVATDFSFDGNENVQYLYLNSNHIVDIHEKAFSELTNLREINLNTNSLDSVPPMFVADNMQLVSLDLSNNFFDIVTPEIYSESLEALDLSSTKISSFEEANVKYLPNLKVINLSYNRIMSIEPSVFMNLPNLLAVDLTGNFWNCDQKTIDLFNFLTDKGFTDVIEPIKCITEEGFYQDIYTSSGPVDIFSVSLEGLDNIPEPQQELVDQNVQEVADNVEETLQENVNSNVNEEIDETANKVVNKDIEDKSTGENEEPIAGIEKENNDGGENQVNEENLNKDDAGNENTAQEENVDIDDTNPKANNDYLEDDQYVNDEGLQDDNQEAANLEDIETNNENLLPDAPEKDENETPENDNKAIDETDIVKLDDKSLEELILKQSGKDNVEDITDTDVIDALNQLVKDEDLDDYGDDYWDNADVYVEPAEQDQKLQDEQKTKQEEEEEAVKQARKVIEEEEKKETAESTSENKEDSPEVGISVIREDQYIVLLERDNDESQYGIYFRHNVVFILGITAFVLTFFMGIFFGFYAIREAYTRKRRREIHGSTNVLISKWSQDLA